jgi:hypothetical protein
VGAMLVGTISDEDATGRHLGGRLVHLVGTGRMASPTDRPKPRLKLWGKVTAQL